MAYGLMRAFGADERDFVVKLGSRTYINDVARAHNLSEEQSKKLLALLDRKQKIPQGEFEAGLVGLGISRQALSPDNPPADISELLERFAGAGIGSIVYDPAVVRGFAYYTGLVFEVFDTDPQNNRSLFGGGRYDNLTGLFDEESVPGVGFGMGDETIRLFLESRGLLPAYVPATHVYFAVTAHELAWEAQSFAGELRRQGVNVAVDFGERKLGEQIKTASKHGIPYLVVVGKEELTTGAFAVRDLATGGETQLGRGELAQFFLQRA